MRDLRIRLIEQLCRVPEAQLPRVEAFLASLASPSVTVAKLDAAACSHAPHKDWPHAPLHRLSEHGTFIVTAATLDKQHVFRGEERLTLLENHLLGLAQDHGIVLEAWAVFSNHYHFVAHTSGVQNQLVAFLSQLHTVTALAVNERDGTPGRHVWCNYWDTALTFEKSYLARLHYVHQNAVKHGLVRSAREYRWCSAAWFEATATKSQVNTLYSFKVDRVNVDDAYDPV